MSTGRPRRYPGSPPPRSPNTVITYGRKTLPRTGESKLSPSDQPQQRSKSATPTDKENQELNRSASPPTSIKDNPGSDQVMQDVPLWG